MFELGTYSLQNYFLREVSQVVCQWYENVNLVDSLY